MNCSKTIRVKLELQDRGIVCIIKVLRRALIIPKELYVVSIVAYQDYQDQDYQDQWMDIWIINKKSIFTDVGLSAHAHNNYCARGQSSHGCFPAWTVLSLLLFSDSCS